MRRLNFTFRNEAYWILAFSLIPMALGLFVLLGYLASKLFD
jgi:hypothetical protein